MRSSVKRVIEAMRLVRHLNKEITTRNIAEILGIKVQTAGAHLQKMAREGLIRRHGMVLQFDGVNRAKNVLWRINTLVVRKLEAESGDIENKEADGPTGPMHDVQGSQATKRVPQDQVQNAQQLV
jgi:Mn-dependent DtxR family transcriptional regulator